MKYNVSVTDQARADFGEIYEYLKQRFGKRAGAKFKASYGKLLKSLVNFPFQYPAINERKDVRKCAAMSPTLVFYKVEGQSVTLLYLKDGRQKGFHD